MKKLRPESLKDSPLQYAPENELGVVFLFSYFAKRLRVRVERIRPHFPDCIAYQKTSHGEKRIRIEFEYKSSSFKNHKHSRRKCDWIVCWEHDWPEIPKNIRIVELRKYFGLGFKIWIEPVIKTQQKFLNQDKLYWGLSKHATKGDLLLMYRATPEKFIKDIFVFDGELEIGDATWREGKCYYGLIKKVCTLRSPIFLEDMRRHKILSTSYFIRRNMQGHHDVTEYWPYLYEMIIKRNPNVKRKLSRYAPEKL